MLWLMLWSLVSTVCSRQAHAHERVGSTARVSLRDGNLTVDLRVGAGSWVGADALLEGTRIRLDGVDVPLKLRRAPSRQAVAEAAVSVAIETDLGGHRHSRPLSVMLESAASGWRGEALEVQLPHALGPVLVTFVQPSTHRIDAGATSRFDVLAAPRGPGAEDHAGLGRLLTQLTAAILGPWLGLRCEDLSTL